MNTTTTKRLGHVVDISRPWPGVGPFLFAMHHLDNYPEGNGKLGPKASVTDRSIGRDFNHPSGWSMYHGTRGVPGFPAHGHKGFETVSIVKSGLVDHADSTGEGARYGPGDVQWVTTGRGVQHSEMFPLVHEDRGNPFELYQIWLNLPRASKKAPPEFKMLWNEQVPVIERTSGTGAVARVRVVAGTFDGVTPPSPPSASWAADPANDVAIWLVDLEPGASITLPAQNTDETKRMLYVHGDGANVDVAGILVGTGEGFVQDSKGAPTLTARGSRPAHVLVLQGREIGEPVVQHGPFVMNSELEIVQAMNEYRATGFGKWRWETDDPVYPASETRFADYGDGRVERPEAAKV